jgi:hypothetical protein
MIAEFKIFLVPFTFFIAALDGTHMKELARK